MADYVITCPAASYDAATNTCAAATWTDISNLSAVANLTFAEAGQIAGACLLVLAVGFTFRMIRQSMLGR